MTATKRSVEIDRNLPVNELLHLLGVEGDTLTVLVDGKPVAVRLHVKWKQVDEATLERSFEAARRFGELVDLDELERKIYEARGRAISEPSVSEE